MSSGRHMKCTCYCYTQFLSFISCLQTFHVSFVFVYHRHVLLRCMHLEANLLWFLWPPWRKMNILARNMLVHVCGDC